MRTVLWVASIAGLAACAPVVASPDLPACRQTVEQVSEAAASAARTMAQVQSHSDDVDTGLQATRAAFDAWRKCRGRALRCLPERMAYEQARGTVESAKAQLASSQTALGPEMQSLASHLEAAEVACGQPFGRAFARDDHAPSGAPAPPTDQDLPADPFAPVTPDDGPADSEAPAAEEAPSAEEAPPAEEAPAEDGDLL
jgi:hypothetical protein